MYKFSPYVIAKFVLLKLSNKTLHMVITFFNDISWGQFAFLFLLVAGAWALWVYKDAFVALSKPPDGTKRVWQPTDHLEHSGQAPPFIPDTEKPPFHMDDELLDDEKEDVYAIDDEFTQMDNLIDEMEFMVLEKRGESDKESLQAAITGILAKYPVLNKEPFKPAINNYTIKLAQKNLSILLNDQELDSLWELRSPEM